MDANCGCDVGASTTSIDFWNSNSIYRRGPDIFVSGKFAILATVAIRSSGFLTRRTIATFITLIVVRDDWHGRGLGQRLVTKLFREAARRRVHIVYCQVMPTNRRMQIFMRRCGFTQTINPDHEVLLRFEKPVAAHEALA